MPAQSDTFEAYGLGDPATSGLDANWSASGVTVVNSPTHAGARAVLGGTNGNMVRSAGCGSYYKASVWLFNDGGDFGLGSSDPIPPPAGLVVQVGLDHPSEDLYISYFVHLTPHLTYLTGVVPFGVWTKVCLEVQLSTADDTFVAADGSIRVLINDTSVFFVDNEFVTNIFNDYFPVDENIWQDIGIHVTDGNLVDDFELSDHCTPPPDGSVPCCGTKPDTPLGPNPGASPTNPPLQPWDRSCAGGGLVPTAPDVIDAEVWSL